MSDEQGEFEDEESSNERSNALTIVGIGASAGGFEAFGQLLSHLPADTGMAFVLVQHLDPTHKSKLSELLSRNSPLPVEDVKNGVKVEANHIYVIPHNVDLRLAAEHLRLTPRKDRGPNMPVDWFLSSLAEELKERAIGVVLSGSGMDGTLGLQAIKTGGGITFAQDEASAKFPNMPQSAVAAGAVDFVLSPEAIAQELGRMARHPLISPLPKAREEAEQKMAEKPDAGADLGPIFGLLRSRTGVDFSLYKISTLRRRILRRMVLHKIEALPAYLKMLQNNPAEIDALFNDVLINVTGFFRDPQLFEILKKKIFPKLLKARSKDSPLRFWVCGCSTGEEAYSLAMALVEFMEETTSNFGVQIFATDISDAVLEKARTGVYPQHLLQNVSKERLHRFFSTSDGVCQVNKLIRDMCLFARQNVLTDPPFSQMDLISCRNVLIYFGNALQKKVLPTFHYALKPQGFLVLGSSETVTASSDLFALVDKRNKIHLKKESALLPSPFLLLRPTPGLKVATPPSPAREQGVEAKKPELQEQVDGIILSRFSPAAVVINKQMEVLEFRGRTGLFLEHAPGKATLNLLKMARESLVLNLRTVINKAIRKSGVVRQEAIPLRHHVRGEDREEVINLEVVPFQPASLNQWLYLVLFEEPAAHAKGGAHRRSSAQKDGPEPELLKLHEELSWTRESLQSTIEEQEATNEELKSANEEIQSSNEELQSTNEEMETAKEELQSTNEELTTLNEELQNRNTEMAQANNDLTNLLSSVNMAIVMLSNDLVIRRFTPMAERVFNIIPSDVGRRLSDLNSTILVPDMEKLFRQVIEDLSFVDREVQNNEGRWYSMRIRPYRTRENKIDGVVLVLVDIDEHRRSIEEMMTMVNQPLLALDSDLRVRKANARFYEMFHVRMEETENRPIYDLGTGQWNIPQLRTLLEEILPKGQRVDNYKIEADFPDLGKKTMVVHARKFYEEGKGLPLILLSIDDVTGKN